MLLALGLVGCGKEPPPVTVDDAAAPMMMSDGGKLIVPPVPPVPVAPFDLAVKLPEPPPPIAGHPGDPLAALRAARPHLTPSVYTPNILVDEPPDGPFSTVHYLIDPGSNTVKAIVATFTPGYRAPERKEALVDAMKIRLGAPEPLSGGGYEGSHWSTIGYRIDLRTDAGSGDLELVFHVRGGRPLLPASP